MATQVPEAFVHSVIIKVVIVCVCVCFNLVFIL